MKEREKGLEKRYITRFTTVENMSFLCRYICDKGMFSLTVICKVKMVVVTMMIMARGDGCFENDPECLTALHLHQKTEQYWCTLSTE